MKYFLINPKTGSATLLYSRAALHDWIFSHSYALSSHWADDISVYRVVVRNGILGYSFYMQGPRICSLREYIVKHKLIKL